MAEGEPAAAEAEAPAEGEDKSKMALMSIRGLGLIVLLLVAEGLAFMLVVKATNLTGDTVVVKTSYIPFDKVTAHIPGGPQKKTPVIYQLMASLEVAADDLEPLTMLINTDMKPLFVDRIMALMEQIQTPSAGRRMDGAKLRAYLKREVRAIFNRELLKLEKYQKMFKKEIAEYKEKLIDPRKKAGAIQPGPIKSIAFMELNF